jgi:hypothetical protein
LTPYGLHFAFAHALANTVPPENVKSAVLRPAMLAPWFRAPILDQPNLLSVSAAFKTACVVLPDKLTTKHLATRFTHLSK